MTAKGHSNKVKLFAKQHLFPGPDLHTRCRYKVLPKLMRKGDLETLDAGFGNGALSYAAFRMGNRVVGISNRQPEVTATTQLFESLEIPTDAIDLRALDLYDLEKLGRSFDQIICSETLEHIRDDRRIIDLFARMLKPKGRLVLCCPFALHPEHALGRIDEPEDGGHVRDGYTLETYRALLEPAGLQIIKHVGLGSSWLCALDRIERSARNRFGPLISLPVFLAMWPLTMFDYQDPKVPFSLAVVAEKL
jgi:cyclopropane fatty-acyl-phospholipid synthase-like methyltransferase